MGDVAEGETIALRCAGGDARASAVREPLRRKPGFKPACLVFMDSAHLQGALGHRRRTVLPAIQLLFWESTPLRAAVLVRSTRAHTHRPAPPSDAASSHVSATPGPARPARLSPGPESNLMGPGPGERNSGCTGRVAVEVQCRGPGR